MKKKEKKLKGVVKEIAAAKAKEKAADKKLGPLQAKCDVCGIEVKVSNLRKSGCPSCGHAGLRAI